MKKVFSLFTSKEIKSKIQYVQINNGWSADPVNPDVSLEVLNNNLILRISLHSPGADYDERSKAKINFTNCSKYSLNTCNDEGFWYGQYRIKPNEMPFGEFYEIISGVERSFPEPVTFVNTPSEKDRHFIFFFKDETFECLAEDYIIEFLQ